MLEHIDDGLKRWAAWAHAAKNPNLSVRRMVWDGVPLPKKRPVTQPYRNECAEHYEACLVKIKNSADTYNLYVIAHRKYYMQRPDSESSLVLGMSYGQYRAAIDWLHYTLNGMILEKTA